MTDRECETLQRLARGMAQKTIAFEFGFSIDTVGNLAANALQNTNHPLQAIPSRAS